MGLQKDSFLSRYFYPVGFGLMGALTPVISNYGMKRPLYASIHRHIALGIAGFLLGCYANNILEKKWAHRDAVIKHYIELHPEDFVEHKRKYKEIFEEWYPIR